MLLGAWRISALVHGSRIDSYHSVQSRSRQSSYFLIVGPCMIPNSHFNQHSSSPRCRWSVIISTNFTRLTSSARSRKLLPVPAPGYAIASDTVLRFNSLSLSSFIEKSLRSDTWSNFWLVFSAVKTNHCRICNYRSFCAAYRSVVLPLTITHVCFYIQEYI